MSATEIRSNLTAELPPATPGGRLAARTSERARAPARSILSRLYVAAWGLAAVLAAAYLTALVFKPQLLDQRVPIDMQTKPESNLGQRATAKAMAEAQPLQDKLQAREQEVARLKSELARRSADYAALRSEFDDIAKPASDKTRDATPRSTAAGEQVREPEAPSAIEADVGAGIPGLSIVNGPSATVTVPTPPALQPPTGTNSNSDRQNTRDVPQPPSLRVLNGTGSRDTAGAATEAGSPIATGSVAKAAADAVRVVLPPLPSQRGVVPPAVAARAQTSATQAPASTPQARRASTSPTTTTPPAQSSGFVTTTAAAPAAVGSTRGFSTTAVPTAPATAATARAGSAGVRLARGASLDALRLSWNLLQQNHGAALARLQPRYLTGFSGNGPSYELVAGPLADATAAEAVCTTMRSRGVPCITGAYGGNALF